MSSSKVKKKTNITCLNCFRDILINYDNIVKCLCCGKEFPNNLNNSFSRNKGTSRTNHVNDILRNLAYTINPDSFNNYLNIEEINHYKNFKGFKNKYSRKKFLGEEKLNGEKIKDETDYKEQSCNENNNENFFKIDSRRISYCLINNKQRKSYTFSQKIYETINEKTQRLTTENVEKIKYLINRFILFITDYGKIQLSINYSVLLDNITNNFNLDYNLVKKKSYNNIKNYQHNYYWTGFLYNFIKELKEDNKLIIKDIEMYSNDLDFDNFKFINVNLTNSFLLTLDKKESNVEYNNNQRELKNVDDKKKFIMPKESFEKKDSLIYYNIFLDNNIFYNSEKVSFTLNLKGLCLWCGLKNKDMILISKTSSFKVCGLKCLTTLIYCYPVFDKVSLYNYKRNDILKHQPFKKNCPFCYKKTKDNSYCSNICKDSTEYLINKTHNKDKHVKSLPLSILKPLIWLKDYKHLINNANLIVCKLENEFIILEYLWI